MNCQSQIKIAFLACFLSSQWAPSAFPSSPDPVGYTFDVTFVPGKSDKERWKSAKNAMPRLQHLQRAAVIQILGEHKPRYPGDKTGSLWAYQINEPVSLDVMTQEYYDLQINFGGDDRVTSAKIVKIRWYRGLVLAK